MLLQNWKSYGHGTKASSTTAKEQTGVSLMFKAGGQLVF